MNYLTKEDKMNVAFSQANIAFEKGFVPVGAAIFKGSQLISKAYNTVDESGYNHHAEMIAIKNAYKKDNNFKYSDEYELVITMEPCLMCYGAILESRIKKITFSVYNKKFGYSNYLNSDSSLFISTGIMEKECMEMYSNFFKSKR